MSTVDLNTLYVAKVFMDFVLVLYTLLIYRRFHKTTKHLAFLPLCRLAVFGGFTLTYASYHTGCLSSGIFGNTLLFISSLFIIYFLSKQLDIPYRKDLHIGLASIFLVTISYTLMVLRSPDFTSTATSLIIFVQFFVFLTDYIRHDHNKAYRSTLLLLLPFTLVHLSRFLASLNPNMTQTDPLTGNPVSASALIIFILLDLLITLSINTQIHRKNLLSGFEDM